MRATLFALLSVLTFAAPVGLEAQFPRRLPTGQPCSAAKPSTRSLSQVVDSAALHVALASVATAGEDSALFSIAYAKDGRVEKVYLALGRMPVASTAAAMVAIEEHLLPLAPSKQGSGGYLRLIGGTSPRVEVPRFTYTCAPRAANPQFIASLLAQALSRLPESIRRLPPERMIATVTFIISREGVPEEVRLVRSSGFAEMDREAVQVVGQGRFHPAQIDGQPVAATATQPLHFRYAAGR
ncbi:MAG: TonB family protein [Gemmatimonadota bacterium]|jgi:TonB family protein|nr:TonB family protein [Gemmatimonadota bacterium]